jgi:2,5-furandicarboxylate decarboxylase 1
MTKINDLRTFLEVLKSNGLLNIVEKEVDLQFEIGSVIATLENKNQGAGLFKKIRGRDFSLCGGVLSSMKSVALALGCNTGEINDFLASCLDKPIKPNVVITGPCQEEIYVNEEVDLNRLPIPQHAPKDGGPIITGGVVISKELYGTKQNLSFHRMQVKGKNKLSIMINEWRHLKEFYNEAEKEGKRLPIAIVSGADPAIYISAGLRYAGNELEIAGAIRGSGVDVVKCITSDIYVPAYAEFVIEGEILPFDREDEGPLGEFTGHYGAPWPSPVIHVTAITHRKDAVYQTINGASFEHINLGNVLPREPLLKKFASHVSSGVINVHIPPYGSGFLALIQIKKKNPGEPKNVALAAMMTYVNIKNVIVVDDDVDIYNPADIMWALSARVIPEKDIFYVPNAQGHELDPCSNERGVQTKMGIDATRREDSRGFERVRYPEVDLSLYIKNE